jgi:dihydrofolate reductase
MVTGHVFIATSLDGFVARTDHGLDWLMKQPTVEGEDAGYGAFMESVDGLVMGTGSLKTLLGFETWPYSKPVYVLSNSLSEADIPADLKGKVFLRKSSPDSLLKELGALGWKRAYVDGARLVQSFLREGLIADVCITLIPILIGEGISLFGPLEADIDLELLRAETLHSGMQQMTYRVV